jgi:hypothetical protein
VSSYNDFRFIDGIPFPEAHNPIYQFIDSGSGLFRRRHNKKTPCFLITLLFIIKMEDATLKRKREEDISLDTDELLSKVPKIAKKATIIAKVLYTLKILKVPSSSIAIVKACELHCECDNANAIKKSLKILVDKKILYKIGQKFWITGEEYNEEPLIGPAIEIIEDKFAHDADADADASNGIASGDEVSIDYELFITDTGIKVEKGKKFTFIVGAGDVIKGMDSAVRGAKLGTKRKINIPWELGYGKRGSGKDVPPCSNLTFHIKIVGIN